MTPSHEASNEASLDPHGLRRRDLFPLVGAAAMAALVAPGLARADDEPDGDDDDGRSAPSRYVYVGTYTAPNTAPGGVVPSTARGIYVFKMNGRTGGLSLIQVFAVVGGRRRERKPPVRDQRSVHMEGRPQ